jgi:hypothetical protein
MGLTRLTAYIIGTRDDIESHAAGPDQHGKFAAVITLGPDDYHRPLLSGPYEFESAEAARERGRKDIELIRELVQEELGGRSPIEAIFDRAAKER